MNFDFDTLIDRHGSWCTQWDFVADRFGHADLLPFTISDMDFATAPCILAALQQRLDHGILGYSRWQHDDFLGAIQHWYQLRFSLQVEAQQIVYGPSVMYMVAQMIRHWSAPDDGVLIHTPAYDAFYHTITANQRRVMALPLTPEAGGWHCDMQRLETMLADPRCKIMLLCSPHNPTGKVWQRDELQQMAASCERHGVRVISDEIHMDMTLGDATHIPWCSLARSDWALFSSASKSFNIPALTGAWGLIGQPADRQRWFSAVKHEDGLSSPAVMAVAAHIAAYREGAPWLDALRGYLQDNLHYIADRLNGHFPMLNWQPPQATFLAWINLAPLGTDPDALQKRLTEQQKVAMMPGRTYGTESASWLRINAGCPRIKLEEGISRLISAIKSLDADN